MGNCFQVQAAVYASDMKKKVPAHMRIYYNDADLTERLIEHYHSEWLPKAYHRVYDETWTNMVNTYLIPPSEWRQEQCGYKCKKWCS